MVQNLKSRRDEKYVLTRVVLPASIITLREDHAIDLTLTRVLPLDSSWLIGHDAAAKILR